MSETHTKVLFSVSVLVSAQANCYLLRTPETPTATQTLESNLDVELAFLMRLVAPQGSLQEGLYNFVSTVLKEIALGSCV